MTDQSYRWIMKTGDVVPLTREDIEAFAAIAETFPGATAESVKLPGIERINLHRGGAVK